jgi:hypothetical protein
VSRWDAFNDRTLAAVEQGMSDYPPNLPFDMQQPTREAIAAYRNGERDPELVFFLATAVSQAVANVGRFRIYSVFMDAASRLSS